MDVNDACHSLLPSQHVVNQFLLPALIGSCITLILNGAGFSNLLSYLRRFPAEAKRVKIAVLVAAFGNLLTMGLQTAATVEYGLPRIHTTESLTASMRARSLLPVAYAFVVVPTQAVLAEWAWRLNGRKFWFGAWIFLCALLSLVTCVWTVAKLLASENSLRSAHSFRVAIAACLIGCLVMDLTVVLGILIGLHRTSKHLLCDTEISLGGAKLVATICQTSVEAAVLPTLLTTVGLILIYVKPTYSAAPLFMLSPVYFLTLLFCLDRRRVYRMALEQKPDL